MVQYLPILMTTYYDYKYSIISSNFIPSCEREKDLIGTVRQFGMFIALASMTEPMSLRIPRADHAISRYCSSHSMPSPLYEDFSPTSDAEVRDFLRHTAQWQATTASVV